MDTNPVVSNIWFKNQGLFVVKATAEKLIDNRIVALKSKTIAYSDGYTHIDLASLGLMPGDAFDIRFKVVAGKGKTTKEKYIYDPTSTSDAVYRMSGTTLSNKLEFHYYRVAGGHPCNRLKIAHNKLSGQKITVVKHEGGRCIEQYSESFSTSDDDHLMDLSQSGLQEGDVFHIKKYAAKTLISAFTPDLYTYSNDPAALVEIN
jgi:hypothetical protein